MTFELPDSQSITNPEVKAFLSKYYEISNAPTAHDDYTDLFTSDGEFYMNAKKAKGKERSQYPFFP